MGLHIWDMSHFSYCIEYEIHSFNILAAYQIFKKYVYLLIYYLSLNKLQT